MNKLIPLILLLVGIGGGVGAGLALRPDAAATGAEESISEGGDATHEADGGTETATDAANDASQDAPGGGEYIKLNNQFVVPIVERDKVTAMIVLSLSLELAPGQSEAAYLHEPKLRDAFLEVMFDHANMGGFDGVFTDTAKLDSLRRGLTDVATGILGPIVRTVLITEFARQPM